jgi:DNA-binding beta-propeller fold protein YncE
VRPSGGYRLNPMWRRGRRRVGGIRPLVLLGMAILLVNGCAPATSAPEVPKPPVRLVLADSAQPPTPWLGSQMRAVDPATLADVPGLAATDFATCGSAPLSRPDGRLLAIATGWLGPQPRGAYPACNVGGGVGLRLFDLTAWAWASDELLLRADSVLVIGWSPDGQRLYALTTSTGSSGQSTSTLWILSPDGSQPPVSVAVPFVSWYWLIAADGSAVYALGFYPDLAERASIAADPTLLAMFDPATGAEQARLELPGVKFGQRRELDARGAPEYWQYFPGLLLSPDGNRAYLAHADEPLLDVIDLRSRRIDRTLRTDVATAARGPLEWLLKLTSRPANAKGGPSDSAWLAASPDGRRLYTRLYGRDVAQSSPVWVIDTSSWEVHSLGTNVDSAILSGDGRWIYVPEWHATGIRVLDAGTGVEVTRLLSGTQPHRLMEYGPDRLFVLVPGPDRHAVPPYVQRDGEAFNELVAFEVGTWRETARRPGSWGLGIATAPF